MAERGRPKSVKTTVEPVVIPEKESLDMSEITKILKSMSEKINSLEKENNELKVTKNKAPLSEKLYREVSFRCVYPGLFMTIRTDNSTIEKLRYDEEYFCTFKEARDIVRLNKRLFELGYVVFEDWDLVKELKLTSYYDNMVKKEEMDNIGNYSAAELEKIYIKANDQWKRMIVNKFMCEYLNGTDPRFSDGEKIQMLSRVSGENIMITIAQLQTAKY